MRPHVVKSVEDADHRRDAPDRRQGSRPHRRQPGSRWSWCKSAMVGGQHRKAPAARRSGAPNTSRPARPVRPRSIGIKQNEKYDASKIAERFRDHSLFVAFAPADKPKIALALIVENGGFGAQAAAPIARKVFDYYLLGKLPKDQDLPFRRSEEMRDVPESTEPEEAGPWRPRRPARRWWRRVDGRDDRATAPGRAAEVIGSRPGREGGATGRRRDRKRRLARTQAQIGRRSNVAGASPRSRASPVREARRRRNPMMKRPLVVRSRPLRLVSTLVAAALLIDRLISPSRCTRPPRFAGPAGGPLPQHRSRSP